LSALLSAAEDWWHRTTAAAGSADGPPIATGAAECRWCPVCQLIGKFRGQDANTSDSPPSRWADAQQLLSGLLRAGAEALAQPMTPARDEATERVTDASTEASTEGSAAEATEVTGTAQQQHRAPSERPPPATSKRINLDFGGTSSAEHAE
jgi:hypothetical protein